MHPAFQQYFDSLRAEFIRLSEKVNGGGRVAGTQGGTPGAAVTYVSNIALDGRNRRIGTTDKASQDTLSDLLRTLAAGKASAA